MIGRTLSHYRVTAALGAGGMGEVYRATDTKLGREVAIKVLPAELAQDPGRLARFEREAKLLASLNHPNIAHVDGFESATLADGLAVHFLAMELVEGEDLSARLKRGPIPVDEALAIAKQIAEALEEAHERGIVHRDLKPANVKVMPQRQGEGAGLRPGEGVRGRVGHVVDRPFAVAHPRARERRRGSSSAPPPTCRPSRRGASGSTREPTSGPSASCSSRCSRAGRCLRARRCPTRWLPCCAPTSPGTRCPAKHLRA